MFKTKKGVLYLIIGIVAFVLLGNIALGSFLSSQREAPNGQEEVTQVQESNDTFSYSGEEGKDAMTLLKEQASVEESSEGFVTSINGRKAEESKKEFWAFYINGEMAQVGAADYITKDEDMIEWKIETY